MRIDPDPAKLASVSGERHRIEGYDLSLVGVTVMAGIMPVFRSETVKVRMAG